MYFGLMPYTSYTLDDGSSVQILQNLTLKAVINDSIKNNLSVYELYNVKDGETPEIVAYKFYRSADLHWIVLLMNDIVDPRFEWPLTEYELMKYCEGKYNNPFDTHHWESVDGYIVNQSTPGAAAIQNYTYESRLNEARRTVKILKPRYVDTIVTEIKEKLSRVR